MRILVIAIIQFIILVDLSGQQSSRRYVRTDHDYDLVAGNVKRVNYQENKRDQFFHRYEYDSENRISHVYSSPDNITWKLECKYFYYDHGALMRVEVGQGVQGTDYAYTLHGWIKGSNSNTLVSARDIGKDGENGLHKNFAKDQIGYSIGYFEEDYKGIQVSPVNSFAAATANSDLSTSLHNGNISHLVTAVGEFMNSNLPPHGIRYTYDQLNRITSATQHFDLGVVSSNAWSAGIAIDDFKEDYEYDANGNILLLKRNAYGESPKMDELSYTYESKANGYNRNTNKLSHVTDAVGANAWEDIESQESGNYSYDEIGNMINDRSENISSISWTLYGKVKQVIKADGAITTYWYDASGNRIRKSSGNKTTYYSRDAGGNVMAIYEKDQSGLRVIERPIHGSDRIGQRNQTIYIDSDLAASSDYRYFKGDSDYELKNHLGNVLAVVSDNTIAVESSELPGTVGYIKAFVITANDYSSFGAIQPGRSFNSKTYRYGFNGKEKDDGGEWGSTKYDYGLRIYNPGIGRFLSVDPLSGEYPWNSTYAFAENDVVRSIDLEGAEKYVRTFSYTLSNGQTTVKLTSDNYKQPEGTFRLGFKGQTTKEVIAEAFVKSNKLPEGGTFSFFEFGPGVPKQNYARYDYTDAGGKQASKYFSAEYIDFMYEQLGIAQENLQKGITVGAAVVNAVGAGTLVKAELKAATNELKAASGEVKSLATIDDAAAANAALAAKYRKNRPSYRDGVVEKTWEAAKDANGKVFDPNTLEELTWDKFSSRYDQWHMGHKPGFEYSKLVEKLEKGEITQQQFLNEYNNPSNYRPEAPGANMSHKYEAPKD